MSPGKGDPCPNLDAPTLEGIDEFERHSDQGDKNGGAPLHHFSQSQVSREVIDSVALEGLNVFAVGSAFSSLQLVCFALAVFAVAFEALPVGGRFLACPSSFGCSCVYAAMAVAAWLLLAACSHCLFAALCARPFILLVRFVCYLRWALFFNFLGLFSVDMQRR